MRFSALYPTLREYVRVLLFSWGRVVPADEAVAVLWACIDGEGGYWTVDLTGNVKRVEKCVCTRLINSEYSFEPKSRERFVICSFHTR